MQRTPLKEFVARMGQIKTAAVLGLTQGGVSKAIRTGRVVYVIELEDGSFKSEEIKPFPGARPVPNRSAERPVRPPIQSEFEVSRADTSVQLKLSSTDP